MAHRRHAGPCSREDPTVGPALSRGTRGRRLRRHRRRTALRPSRRRHARPGAPGGRARGPGPRPPGSPVAWCSSPRTRRRSSGCWTASRRRRRTPTWRSASPAPASFRCRSATSTGSVSAVHTEARQCSKLPGRDQPRRRRAPAAPPRPLGPRPHALRPGAPAPAGGAGLHRRAAGSRLRARPIPCSSAALLVLEMAALALSRRLPRGQAVPSPLPLHRRLPDRHQPALQPRRPGRALARASGALRPHGHRPGTPLRARQRPAALRRRVGLRPLQRGARRRRPARAS